jgi:hypothetical protein
MTRGTRQFGPRRLQEWDAARVNNQAPAVPASGGPAQARAMRR